MWLRSPGATFTKSVNYHRFDVKWTAYDTWVRHEELVLLAAQKAYGQDRDHRQEEVLEEVRQIRQHEEGPWGHPGEALEEGRLRRN